MGNAGQSSRQYALLHPVSSDSVTIDVLTDEGNDPVCFFRAAGIFGLVGTAKQGVGLLACVNIDMHAHTKRCHFLSSCSTLSHIKSSAHEMGGPLSIAPPTSKYGGCRHNRAQDDRTGTLSYAHHTSGGALGIHYPIPPLGNPDQPSVGRQIFMVASRNSPLIPERRE